MRHHAGDQSSSRGQRRDSRDSSLRNLGGRRPDRAKDAAILEAAKAIFLSRGYTSSTIEDVAACAGVSKVTIYKRWRDKEALYVAVVDVEMAALAGQLWDEPRARDTVADQLEALGSAMLEFLFSPAHVALGRMLASDRAHSPQAARRFFDLGFGYCRTRLAAEIRIAATLGLVEVDDPTLAADDLLALWCGALEWQVALGNIESIDHVVVRPHVQRGTRRFLKMVAPVRSRSSLSPESEKRRSDLTS